MTFAGKSFESPQTPPRRGGLPRVLVIEDNIDDVTLLRAFGEGKLETTWCSSSRDAIAKIDGAWEWDVVLLDVNLPGTVNGWQLVDMLRRSEHKNVPMIVWTNGVSSFDRTRAESRNVAIIAKPDDLDGYDEIVTRLAGIVR